MKMIRHALKSGFALGVVAAFAGSPAQAAAVKAQGPCTYVADVCAAFDFNDDIPVISSFEFILPAAGTVLVMFDGTMQCQIASNVNNINVVDLAAQIVTSPRTVAQHTGPGGNRYAMRLHYRAEFTNGPSATVNLAASRTIRYTSGGKKTVYFKFNKLRMDIATACFVNAASFTVLTTP